MQYLQGLQSVQKFYSIEVSCQDFQKCVAVHRNCCKIETCMM